MKVTNEGGVRPLGTLTLGWDPDDDTEDTPPPSDRALDIPTFGSPPASVVALTSSPDGGWPSVQSRARATNLNGVVYVGWVDSAGNIEMAAYTDSTGVIIGSIFTLHATLEADWHNAPAVAALSDGRIITAYCKHAVVGGPMYIRVSTNPDDISAFDAEIDISAQLGGDMYTYTSLFVEPSGKVWLFYRTTSLVGGETSRWAYSTSTDDGATWAAQTIFYSDPLLLPYMYVEFDGTDRFDIAMTSSIGAGSDIGHFYLTTSGGKFQTDGSVIASAFPLAFGDITLVHDGSAGGARNPSCIIGNNGFPAITWPEINGGGFDHYYALWDGSAWTSHNVVSDSSTGDAWVEGGFVLEAPGSGFLARAVTGNYQVFTYVSTDDGATWAATQLTASVTDDFYPSAVRNALNIRAVWLRGTASSFTSYALQVMSLLSVDTQYGQMTDGDDATCDTVVGGTDVARIVLADAFRIVRSRLLIASENAGSRTYSIYGAVSADFSDEVLLASVTFTATGSFTEQDFILNWADDGTPRQYYRLEGTDETRCIHTWSLYTASSDLSDYATLDDLEAHVDDTLEAHAASAVEFTPTGDLVAVNVQDAIVEVAADAAAALAAAESGGVSDHEHIVNVVFSGDASTTVWELPAAPVDATSLAVYVTGARTIAWVLSGSLLTTLTFDSAPASAADNIVIDIVAATA